MNGAHFPDRWRARPFILLHLAAALLWASWFAPALRPLWDALDARVFYALNAVLLWEIPLIGGDLWRAFWAAANTRAADGVAALLLLALLFLPRGIFPPGRKLPALLGMVVLLGAATLPLREAFSLLSDAFAWRIPSPSQTLELSVHLGALFPDWAVKVESSNSFPGDHAIVLFCLAGFILFFAARRRAAWGAVALLPLFLLPRMVAGAHWLSDNLAGGAGIALIALAWTHHTPLAARAGRLLTALRGRRQTKSTGETAQF